MGIGSADPPLSLRDISPPRSGGRGERGSNRRVGESWDWWRAGV